MIKKKIVLLFSLLLQTIFLSGQNYVFESAEIPSVSISGINLPNPWAGGLNSIQVNKMDLNNDSIEDLVLYDRVTSKLSTFLAVNNQFIYAPEYESFFPVIINWIYIADYNGDGKKDIFTSSKGIYPQEILIYKNVGNSTPRWATAIDGMKSKDGNGFPIFYMQVGLSDYPGIIDIDDDGDLDFFVYNGLFGGIEFHKNNSVEKFSNRDSLNEFEKYYSCWGQFDIGYDCGNLVRINQTCPNYGGTHDNERVQHNGSTITFFDLNGDGIKDMLLGDVGCNNVYALTNAGTNLIGKITSIDTNYPPSLPINIISSPATFYQDLDFDGVKDLSTSPNVYYVSTSTNEFTKSLWFYKNTGTTANPQFSFTKDNFMQDGMIELGENAAPALADYDHDGDLDLFVGTKGKLYGTNFYATISLFENKGTKEKAEFLLVTDDYLSLSGFNLSRIKPGFSDINNDGALDIYFFNTSDYFTSSPSTQITYVINQNASNLAFKYDISLKADLNLNTPLSSYSYDSPFFSDIDNNNIKELLIGKETGQMQCFSNTGTVLAPFFTKVNESFGGLVQDNINYVKILLSGAETHLNNKDTTELITVDNSGMLRIYPNFKSHLQKLVQADSNIILNKVNSYSYPSYFGSNLSIAAGDLNGDSLSEIIIGTGGGGLIFLKNMRKKVITITPIPKDSVPVIDTTTPNPPTETDLKNTLTSQIKVYPNPFTDEFYIQSPEQFQGLLINVLGEVVKDINCSEPGECKVNVNNLPKGIYFMKIYLHNTYINYKLSKE